MPTFAKPILISFPPPPSLATTSPPCFFALSSLACSFQPRFPTGALARPPRWRTVHGHREPGCEYHAVHKHKKQARFPPHPVAKRAGPRKCQGQRPCEAGATECLRFRLATPAMTCRIRPTRLLRIVSRFVRERKNRSSFQVSAMIDGTINPSQLSNIGTSEVSGVSVGYLRTGIVAGTKTVKLQYRVYSAGATAHIEVGWLVALAVTE
jgi:hypothetical protein